MAERRYKGRQIRLSLDLIKPFPGKSTDLIRELKCGWHVFQILHMPKCNHASEVVTKLLLYKGKTG